MTQPARHSHLLDRLTLATILVLSAATVTDALAPLANRYTVISLLTLFALLLVCAMVAMAWRRSNDPDIRLIALGFGSMVFLALFPVTRNLGLIPSSFLTRYGLLLGAAIEMPLLLYALSVRGGHRREAMVRAKALAATDPLTGLTHRRIFMIRLEAAMQRARTQRIPGALLGVDVANLAAINSGHGREAADRALVLAASRLRGVLGDVDLASRVGEQQFALLLEGPTTADQARLCATHVVARGLRESTVLPDGVTLNFHVTVTMLPATVANPEQLLRWALAEVHELPSDGKKAIRTLNF